MGSSEGQEKRNAVKNILEGLKPFSLSDSLEILANVIILEGAAFLGAPPSSSHLQILDIAIEKVKTGGRNNLPASTVMLGVDILESLAKVPIEPD